MNKGRNTNPQSEINLKHTKQPKKDKMVKARNNLSEGKRSGDERQSSDYDASLVPEEFRQNMAERPKGRK